MSFQNIDELKYFINNNINTNGQALITGAKMNTALNGLADLLNQSIEIPIPQITREREQVAVHTISSNPVFRNFNPEYFLFRYKRDRRYRSGRGFLPGANRWVHPVHLDGSKWAGNKFFGGQSVLPTSQAAILRTRQTEWSVADKDYERILLNFHGKEYYYDGNTGTYGNPGFPIAENNLALSVTGNGNSGDRPIAAHFKIAIAIDNPAYTPGSKICPKIFGPMSHTISYYPRKEGSYYIGWGLKLHCSFPKMR